MCPAVAFLTLAVTLTIRFISQRSQKSTAHPDGDPQYGDRDGQYPCSRWRQKHATLLSMVGKPCQDVHLELRKNRGHTADRTLNHPCSIRDGLLLQHFFGPRHVAIHQLQPTLPAVNPLLAFFNR